jgi:hypothetical protein
MTDDNATTLVHDPQQQALFATLLGPAWLAVAPAVRRLHATAVHARGRFRVRRGAGWLARLIAACCGMPRAGEDVPMTLVVDRDHHAERWSRRFGDRAFHTRHWARRGRLMETLRLVHCGFRLRVERGALVFDQVSAAFGFRWFAVPIPRLLAPSIEARAEAPEICGIGDGTVRVTVRVTHPVIGLLVAYDGVVATCTEGES